MTALMWIGAAMLGLIVLACGIAVLGALNDRGEHDPYH